MSNQRTRKVIFWYSNHASGLDNHLLAYFFYEHALEVHFIDGLETVVILSDDTELQPSVVVMLCNNTINHDPKDYAHVARKTYANAVQIVVIYEYDEQCDVVPQDDPERKIAYFKLDSLSHVGSLLESIKRLANHK